MKKDKQTDEPDSHKVQRVFDAALARALNTPHKPHKPLKATKKKAKKA